MVLKGKRFDIAGKVLKEEIDACEELLDEVYERQLKIHKIMVRNGFISQEDYEKAKKDYIF
jgi:hypothetical protein